jgi:aryl-alcohol dehydrogenase-like predicted oxidoreductase
MLERDIEEEILPWCVAHGTGIVAYSPMQSGLLTGSFDKAKLAADDWRITHSEKFRGEKYTRGLSVVERVRPIAAQLGKTVGQLGVAWVLSNPAITSAIVGARKVQQVEANVLATGWSFSQKDLDSIEKALS